MEERHRRQRVGQICRRFIPSISEEGSYREVIRMGWRFRRSFNFGGFRLNLSKSGIGGSLGIGPFRVGRSATQKTYASARVPGTGLWWFKWFGNSRRASQAATPPPSNQTASQPGPPSSTNTQPGPPTATNPLPTPTTTVSSRAAWWKQKGLD